MRETCSCSKEGLRQPWHRGSSCQGGKTWDTKGSGLQAGSAAWPEAGAALPGRCGSWQVPAPLAGPFLEEQDLLHLQPKAFQPLTRESSCCSARVKEDTWRRDLSHHLRQNRSPLPAVAEHGAQCDRWSRPQPVRWQKAGAGPAEHRAAASQ